MRSHGYLGSVSLSPERLTAITPLLVVAATKDALCANNSHDGKCGSGEVEDRVIQASTKQIWNANWRAQRLHWPQ